MIAKMLLLLLNTILLIATSHNEFRNIFSIGTISITPTPSSTIQASSSASPTAETSSNAALIAGLSVTIVIIALLVVAVVVCIIIVVYCKRKQKPFVKDTPQRTSIKYNITNQGQPGKEEETGHEEYAVVNKKPPPIPPQNLSGVEYDVVDSKKSEKTEKPKLAQVTNLNGFQMVDNSLYDKSPTNITSHYSYATNYEAEKEIYSEPQWNDKSDELNIANPVYYGKSDPFRFTESADYVDGAIYAEPSKVVNTVKEVTIDNLNAVEMLGIGNFGEVLLATTINLSLKDLRLSQTNEDKSISIYVAVKKVKEDHDPMALESFRKEVKFMSQLDHDHVVRLLAVSASSCPEQFIVMEYMENGDLNQYLLNQTFTSTHPPPENHLSPQILLSMCIQIANGMSYLASSNYIHRDLATRNVLVGKDNIVKVGDFGLSRNLYDSVYYKVSGKAKMPIRWMSTECFYGKFSEKSDVWAYGITVWEVYNMSREVPYHELTDSEVVDDALKDEYRMLPTRPTTCPKPVYDIIKKCCWEYNTEKREKFSNIYSQLIIVEQSLYSS